MSRDKKPPPLSSGNGGTPANCTTGTCPKCCCCVFSATIQNVQFIGSTPTQVGTGYQITVTNGHVFDFVMSFSFAAGIAGISDCDFEWWEKVDLPALPGHSPNTWTELHAMFPTNIAFNPWNNRQIPCPGGGSLSITITDPPSLGNAPGQTLTRTLEFSLVAKSGAGCGCGKTSATATATQVLVMVNGTLDTSASSFTIGPSSTTP